MTHSVFEDAVYYGQSIITNNYIMVTIITKHYSGSDQAGLSNTAVQVSQSLAAVSFFRETSNTAGLYVVCLGCELT